jgi:5-methylcytosine-specific restriction endonuclease McrA
MRRCLRKKVLGEMWSREQVCSICKISPVPWRFTFDNPFEIDHITPLSLGGTNDIENLRWLCRYHNRAMRDKMVWLSA